jgi:carbon-monoxide dehydrogenase medium subunit
LAGGTDLLLQLKQRQIHTKCLIDLKSIPELRGIDLDGDNNLHVGALTTVSEIIDSRNVIERLPVLRQVAEYIGSCQVRNKATIGGNICRAAPSADFAPILLALDAKLKILGLNGERDISLDVFFAGPGRTVMLDSEILKEVIIKIPSGAWVVKHCRQSIRKTMDLALISVAVFLTPSAGKRGCEQIRIAVGSAAPTPMRARKTEQYLLNKDLTPERVKEASCIAAQEAEPITDAYGSAWYKRELVRVLIYRTISKACGIFGFYDYEA